MNLDLSPDQRLFQSTTREFLHDTTPISRIRELAETGTGFDREWWRQAAGLGWTSMLVPEHLGGGSISGAPMTDLAIVAGELGRACAPGALTTTSAVLTGLVRAGFTDAVSAIVEGESLAAWAFCEPGRGLDRFGATATPDGAGFRLSGGVDRVESGDQADVFLVTARGPDGLVQLLVPADAPGVTVTPVWTLDLVRRTAHVDFADVAVEPASVVQRGTDAADAFEAQLLVAAALASAEMAGALERTMEFTVRWMFDRYTFGRPLASYQALKHRMADNKTWLEACHATANAAARLLDEDPSAAVEAVSAAKSYIGAKAPAVIQDCVQMHGGIGVTWEHDIHLFLRRVTLYRALYGTPEEHRRRIADLPTRSAA
ncbi:acyl-CoA/acyl-ACP dehydrogenase [Amycolatopsis sp. K13G38]|uniref:Acyl-CoA/acyl-ACP dehydrogenase n=1 Tax=Amycolatopsis acididurans TaxID=2724524 RepID=A0ABX1IVK3_9PSEU|nr:acyl-CoA dehydrogenase family protein [Amycolatopsis acididurans]NKQ51493.1 acyl-CoA/acyl-ACP dehydrogenase [Amycolatopsis acididurans]